MNDRWAGGLRFEWFRDEDGVRVTEGVGRLGALDGQVPGTGGQLVREIAAIGKRNDDEIYRELARRQRP